MNKIIIDTIANRLTIKPQIVEQILTLLAEGNTVHFLARYRKEQIGDVDEEIIREIDKTYQYQQNLQNRKETIKNRIAEQGMLTVELQTAIDACTQLTQLEQLYEPYKSKKITKAKLAIQGGLEPLATQILAQNGPLNLTVAAEKYLNETFPTIEDVLENAQYLVAQIMSEQVTVREWLKRTYYHLGTLEVKSKKNAQEIDQDGVYKRYYEFSSKINKLADYQVLAINRAEKAKVLQVKMLIDNEKLQADCKRKYIRNHTNGQVHDFLLVAMQDALKRLLLPSIQREIRTELTQKAEKKAIELFGKNVFQLLMQQPLTKQTILGFDPAFRTGCKLAVINAQGDVEEIAVIYPHVPQKQWQQAKDILTTLYNKYKFSLIAIGNGTASRESEQFVTEWLETVSKTVKYAIVSEAGASVYSASKIAINEFPDYSVEQRSAVSIARRLLDPLSELVKIDPKALGVGQYQHDLNETELNNELTYTVNHAVNTVGVDLNIASSELLQYISGLSRSIANNIVAYRSENNGFTSRQALKKVKGLGPKAYEQAAGFLRIINGENELDNTNIHPESYKSAKAVLKLLGCKPASIGTTEMLTILAEKRATISPELVDTDKFTLNAIFEAFANPLRDERDNFAAPVLKSTITTLEDLTIGMELEGVVRNITDFGAFIDIGLKNDGFVHIAKIAPRFIKHPADELSIGEIRTVYIENIYLDRNKVELTLLKK
jgi:Transcriptional accessory protein